MEVYIKDVCKVGDMVGGVVSVVIIGCLFGLGEFVFDKFYVDLVKVMFSINVCKGFEYGLGFDGVSMCGSEYNDVFCIEGDCIVIDMNYFGGVQGGIFNGMDIYFRFVFKLVAMIVFVQDLVNEVGEKVMVEGKGWYDLCVVFWVVFIVEVMAVLILVDYLLW